MTLTIPIACESSKVCFLFVLSYIPDALPNECRVSSIEQPDNEFAPCGTVFHSKETIPATKTITVRAIAGGVSEFLSREFGMFLSTNIPDHPFAHDTLLGIVRVSIRLDFYSHLFASPVNVRMLYFFFLNIFFNIQAKTYFVLTCVLLTFV